MKYTALSKMIKEFSVVVKGDFEEFDIDKVLTLGNIDTIRTDWKATWTNDEDYMKGFAPDSQED